jgi:hypothetical protein
MFGADGRSESYLCLSDGECRPLSYGSFACLPAPQHSRSGFKVGMSLIDDVRVFMQ